MSTIFLIEDNPTYQLFLKNLLHNKGYSCVLCFSTGQDALDNLYQNPSLIFLDYHLHDGNGLEVLKAIKAYNTNIPVVMLSGQEDIAVAVNTMRYGAIDYLIKDDWVSKSIDRFFERLDDYHRLMKQQQQSTVSRIASIFRV